ncbi:MAG: hypothetical protein J0H98_11490 [Solirubrobacterales bacterium]|nr:hypothetical protein [Solirubrobacterales bacterium]
MAGSLPLDDGRYLDRTGESERVLVLETEGALPPARRRRRRPRKAVETDAPVTVTVTVVTVVRAGEPFAGESEAAAWLGRLEEEEFTEELLEDAIAALDRARAADATASGVPFGTPTSLSAVLSARIGYGEGERVASGRYLEALEIDARGGTGGVRRERAERTKPLARTAAILGGRELATGCEVLIPRVRLDLATGNQTAAAIAIRPAVQATIAELEFALDEPEHEQDLDRLEELLPSLEGVADRAVREQLSAADLEALEAALGVAERVIRRRRVLDQ